MPLGIEDAQDFIVLEEPVQVEIGDDHLAWAKAAAMNDVIGIHVDETRFGSGNHLPGVVEREAAGTQAIAVEDCADLVAVSECQCSGAVPWLDAVAAVLQE